MQSALREASWLTLHTLGCIQVACWGKKHLPVHVRCPGVTASCSDAERGAPPHIYNQHNICSTLHLINLVQTVIVGKKTFLENHKTQSTYYICCAYLSVCLCVLCGCICFLCVFVHAGVCGGVWGGGVHMRQHLHIHLYDCAHS